MPGPMRRERRSGWATGVAGDAGVDDAERDADRAGEDVGGGVAGEEVQEHLPGDGLRVGGDAFVGEAVVGGEDGELAGRHPRVEAALGAGDLRGEVSMRPRAPSGLVLPSIRAWRRASKSASGVAATFRLLAGCRALA